MVVEKLFAIQAHKRREDQIRKLQGEAPQHLLERTVCDVNDCLTSILAICDAEADQTVPKIKKYIQRVNQSLLSLKNYQAAVHQKKRFNITLVLENVLNVMEENFKGTTKIVRLISDIKAMAQGNPADLEEFLLYALVSIVQDDPGSSSDLLVELRQKNQDAVITILKDRVRLSEDFMKEMEERSRRFIGIAHITPQVEGVEIMIRVPLAFEARTENFYDNSSFHIQSGAHREKALKT